MLTKYCACSLSVQSPVACVMLVYPNITVCNSSYTLKKKARMLEKKENALVWTFFQTGSE